MLILPLRAIAEEDRPIFGDSIYNLAKLFRAGLPVASGIALSFDEAVKKNLVPSELTKELKGHKSLFFEGGFFNKKESLWRAVAESFEAHKSAKVVFFPDGLKNLQQFLAYFNPHLKEVVIKNMAGVSQKINPLVLKEIDSLVLQANKKLFIPQVYKFLVSNKIEMVEVLPFTHSQEISSEKDYVMMPLASHQKARSTLKIFLNTLSNIGSDEIDGFFIEGEKMLNFEDTILRLVSIASDNLHKPVIYKLPDINDEDVGGSLRLIYQKNLLDSLCSAFLFARNKKNLLNLEIALPRVRSIDEFLQIKRELAARGIARKGMLKVWVEITTPDNILNLEKYIEAGVDGVILNLDSLQKLLLGYSLKEREFYKKEVTTLSSLLFLASKTLHKYRVPFLAKGELTTHQDILDLLVKEGAGGIIAENILEAQNLPEHLRWTERRIIIKITASEKLQN